MYKVIKMPCFCAQVQRWMWAGCRGGGCQQRGWPAWPRRRQPWPAPPRPPPPPYRRHRRPRRRRARPPSRREDVVGGRPSPEDLGPRERERERSVAVRDTIVLVVGAVVVAVFFFFGMDRRASWRTWDALRFRRAVRVSLVRKCIADIACGPPGASSGSMVDLGGYIIILMHHSGKMKLYGESSTLLFVQLTGMLWLGSVLFRVLVSR